MPDSAILPPGYTVERFPHLGSTNDEASARGRSGTRGPLWIVADRQTRGKGRLGRSWSSPAGNLYASLLVVDPCDVAQAAELGFVAGLALARAAIDASDNRGIRLKWPNDLVLDGAKLAGVLVECTRSNEGRLVAVLGFGVNCRSHPAGLPYPANDLSTAGACEVGPERLFPILAARVAAALDVWDRGRGFAAIREAWTASALPPGTPLKVVGARPRVGRFAALDARGRLLLETADGLVAIEAGDVFTSDHDVLAEELSR